jgi:peptidoglycan/LPS O-acetylase OafA/YrhL
MANVRLRASDPVAGGKQIVISLHLRFAAGVFCVLVSALLMGAGGAVAVADPGSSGSAAHGNGGTNASGQHDDDGNASGQHGNGRTNASGQHGNGRTNASGQHGNGGTNASGQHGNGGTNASGQQPSTGANSPSNEPGGTDTTDETNDSGIVAAGPDPVAAVPDPVAAPAPDPGAPVPDPGAPALDPVAPALDPVAPVPGAVAPVPDSAPPVPNAVAPVPSAVAPARNAAAPAPDAAASVPNLVAAVPNEVPPVTNVVPPVSDVVASVPNLVAAVPNEVPPVTNVVPPVSDVVAPVPNVDVVAPVPNVDVVAPVPTGHAHANFIEGAGVLLLAGLLAYLTLRYVENPLRYRAPAATAPIVAIPLWPRLRRPTIVLGSVMTLAPPRPAPVTAESPPPRAAIGNQKSDFYRHDLDGLRGTAIALVVVFHVWFGRVSGGVDVFLALSGFLFGDRLLRTALTPGASLWPVPEVTRLVRRLLPALVVVLAASALLTIVVQPETRWETFADQSLASLGYFQNWQLANTASDYLRAGEAVSPLQHIWSMSVQGQFYIAFLALIFSLAYLFQRILSKYLRTSFVVLLSSLTIASFVYAICAHNADAATAYYNSFARAWELLLGALVGALVPYVRWPMWLRTTVAVVALAAILSCGALIDGVKEFPGPWALVPVGATMLVILSAANRIADPHIGGRLPAPNRLLASQPFLMLGAMAYSLYLWHWPLLIFWLSYTGHTHANFVEGAGVLLLSGVLAYLTLKYVENPLRYRAKAATRRTVAIPLRTRLRRPTIVLGSAVALLGVTLTATSFTWREHVTVQRANGKELSGLSTRDYPGALALLDHAKVAKLPMRPTVLEAEKDLPETTIDGCISDFANVSVINCTYGDKAATRSIALAGGSHAEHWITALDLLGQLRGFKVVTYLKMGCPLTTEQVPLMMGDNRPYPKCHDWNQRVIAKLIGDHPDYVFTTSTRPWNIKPGDVMPASYVGIWQALSDNNIPILAMRDTPWMVRNGRPYFPANCLADGGDAISCGVKRSDVLSDRNPTLDFVARFPLLKPLDMSDAVCRKDICRAVEGNVLPYHDSHHLSTTYMRTMTSELGRQIGAATRWW